MFFNKKKQEKITEEIEEEKTMNEKVDEIYSALKKHQHKKGKKEIDLPFSYKFFEKSNAKNNKIPIIKLSRNKDATTTWGTLEDGLNRIKVGKEEKFIDGSVATVWRWKRKIPIVIWQEWSTTPLNAEEDFKKAIEEQRLLDPQTVLIHGLEKLEDMKDKPKMNWNVGMVIGLIVLIGVVIYIFMNGAH